MGGSGGGYFSGSTSPEELRKQVMDAEPGGEDPENQGVDPKAQAPDQDECREPGRRG